MLKIASIALSAALGVAGIATTVPAEAHPYVSVGIGVPGFAPAYYAPYRYEHSPYWRPGFGRYEHGRFYRRWDRR
jgi:hypothetical protein